MANAIEKLVPKILVNAMMLFRNNSITANLVNRDYDQEFAKKGDTVNIPVYSAPTVKDVNAGRGNNSTVDGIAATTIDVKLDQWKQVEVEFSDLELKKIEDGRPSEALQTAVVALVDYVDAWALNKMAIGTYNLTGTNATKFNDPSHLTGARTLLSKANAPMQNRRAILSPDVVGGMSDNSKLEEFMKAGDNAALREAAVGKIKGFDTYENNNLADWVAGDLAAGTALQTNAVATAGSTGLTLKDSGGSLTGTLKAGDVISFAGHTGNYVVTSEIEASSNLAVVALSPALREDVALNEAVTIESADYTNAGLAFHRNAFAFSSRPLETSFTGGNIVQSLTDPTTGITLRYELSRDNKAVQHSLDILFGGKVIKPEMITRLRSASF